jgi:cobalt-precorrin-6B (C15)-methyltransferase
MVSGGPTKAEIIAIALEKLQISSGETFADIGCGTGNVSIAASKKTNKIIAVDQRSESIETAKKNFSEAGVSALVTLLRGEAPDVLEAYANAIDKAFIGGTKNFRRTIDFLVPHCRRFVLNAARLEVTADAIGYMKELGVFKEALLVNIAKGHELENLTAFTPYNPVFMVVGSC